MVEPVSGNRRAGAKTADCRGRSWEESKTGLEEEIRSHQQAVSKSRPRLPHIQRSRETRGLSLGDWIQFPIVGEMNTFLGQIL